MEQQYEQQKIVELQNEIAKLKEERNKGVAKMNEEIVELKEKNAKLEEENRKLNEKMAKMVEDDEKIGKKRKLMNEAKQNSEKKRPKSSIHRRPLPAELMNELFVSLPLKNVICLLAKMPNGLLARKVQKIVNCIKMAMKGNKWNVDDFSPNLITSEDGLNVTYSGPNRTNCVLATLPVPMINLAAIKPQIALYFEVQILKRWGGGHINIGFEVNDKNDEKGQNSIRISHKRSIWINGTKHRLIENAAQYLRQGEVIGLGIINCPSAKSPIKCFATCNGKLLGKVELPPIFAKLQLFPAIIFCSAGESVRTNFGKEKWRFKQFEEAIGCEKCGN